MSRSLRLAAALAAATFTAGAARAQQPADAVRDSVLGVVQRFFDAMAARDTAALSRTLVPEGHLIAIAVMGDSARVNFNANRDFVTSFPQIRQHWLERMWSPQVLLRGPLAVVWTTYDFHLDGKFSHCGVDSFTVIRGRDGWRIADVAFTMEPTGCPPSPLGPPR